MAKRRNGKQNNGANLGFIDDAMTAIEKDNPSLKGVLPKDYGRASLDKQRLGELIDLIGTIGLGDAESHRAGHGRLHDRTTWPALLYDADSSLPMVSRNPEESRQSRFYRQGIVMNDNLSIPSPDDSGEFLLYQTEDGQTRIDVRMGDETVWLSQKGMADLFQTTKQNVSLHLQNIYEEGELPPEATVKKYLTVQTEGNREVSRTVDHYNLDAILAVGYRVRSHRGTQFRIWATERLREYLIKGFAMDDQRLKRAGGGNYFEELLARIRDIRSSERVFWRKVLDIYATSIDYDPQIKPSPLSLKDLRGCPC